MAVNFVPLSSDHAAHAMAIFNYYVETSFSAYPDEPLPEDFFGKLLEMTEGYPAYAIMDGEQMAGFCLLRPWNVFHTFRETAEISYFLGRFYTGQGIGTMALAKLETEAVAQGIHTLLASISSENLGSIRFHEQNGFTECGRFRKVGKKKGKYFDVVWMQKDVGRRT